MIRRLALALIVFASPVWAVDSYFGGRWGPSDHVAALILSGVNNYTMSSLNNGWSARFQAKTTADITSVRVRWTSVSAAGQVTVRIETDDGAGKPSGTLYDANAVLTAQVPSTAGGAAGQLFTFSSAPTTGLTAGSLYHVVIITTTAGTTHSLTSYVVRQRPQSLPSNVLTASDATTRSNFTEVANATPIVVLGLEDSTFESLGDGLLPYATSTTQVIHGTNGVALKATTTVSMSVVGIALPGVSKTGNPAGDLRVRIFDTGNSTVSGASITLDKDAISTNISTSGLIALFPGTVTLPAGTYRVVLDCASCANSSHCWNANAAVSINSSASPSGFLLSTSSDLSSWSDTAGSVPGMSLMIENATGGGGSAGVIGG